MHFHAEALGAVRARVVALLERRGQITVGELRDELGSSRKFAQALLEHFDGEHLTRRAGDAHVLRRRSGARAGAPL
jgi:selenocysteine-specific elongation factor